MRVVVSGVDVDSDAGADHMLRRIQAAADEFCDNRTDVRDLRRRAQTSACAERMAYLAVRTLDAPLVTARFEQRSRNPVRFAHR